MSARRVKVGDYGYEICRFSVNINGEIEKQGKGVEGKIVGIKRNRGKKVVLAEIEAKTGVNNHFVPIKFITNNKNVFDYLNGIEIGAISGTSRETSSQSMGLRALKAEEFIADITMRPWWKGGIRKMASEFMTKIHLK